MTPYLQDIILWNAYLIWPMRTTCPVHLVLCHHNNVRWRQIMHLFVIQILHRHITSP